MSDSRRGGELDEVTLEALALLQQVERFRKENKVWVPQAHQTLPSPDEIVAKGYQYLCLLGGRNSGKRLHIDTRLPTPTGEVAMGDVAVGDTVLDENGKPCQVTYISPIVTAPALRVVFEGGYSLVADPGHLWMVWDRIARMAYHSSGGVADRSMWPEDWAGWRSYSGVGPKIVTTGGLLRSLDSGPWIPRVVPEGGYGTLEANSHIIDDIVDAGTAPMRCITVDSPHSLYLAGDEWVPTHNTYGAVRHFHDHMMDPRPCSEEFKGGHRGLIIGQTLGYVKESCIDPPSGIHAFDPDVDVKTSIGGTKITFRNGAEALLIGMPNKASTEMLRPAGNRCVVAGTSIESPSGHRKRIENIVPGDYVVTRYGDREVLDTFRFEPEPTWMLETGGGHKLECTYDHEVYVEDVGWVEASNVQVGVSLQCRGRSCAVTVSKSSGRACPTFDISVDYDQEYFSNGILSHNCSALVDELAAIKSLKQMLKQLEMVVRRGRKLIYVATTPQPKRAFIDLVDNPKSFTNTGSLLDNIHGDEDFKQTMLDRYAGTRWGVQEIEGGIIREIQGALWTPDTVGASVVRSGNFLPRLDGESFPAWATRSLGLHSIVVGVDPATSGRGDETGIIVVGATAGKPKDRVATVLADYTKLCQPSEWREIVAEACITWGTPTVVAEDNRLGETVQLVLGDYLNEQFRVKGFAAAANIKRVTANVSKAQRADPVASIWGDRVKMLVYTGDGSFTAPGGQRFDEARIVHADLEDLENEMTSWVPADGDTVDATDEGDDDSSFSGSPDRIDAMVHAVTHLLGLSSAKPKPKPATADWVDSIYGA